MKTPILLGVLLACAAPMGAQPADTAPKLVNDLPFPLLAPDKAQLLAVPQPIIMNLNDVTLGVALDELKKQSGVEFGTREGNYNEQLATKVSVAINTLSFDEAFRQIFAAAGMKATLQDWGGDQAPQLSIGDENPANKPRKSGAGLFGIDLSNLSTSFGKSVDLSNFDAPNRSENSSLTVNLALRSDRRLPIIGSPQTRVTRADDDKGRSLIPTLDENERNSNRINRYNFYGNSTWEQKSARFDLNVPAEGAKTIAQLEGVVVYAVVSKSELWEVPDLLSKPQWTHTFTGPSGTIAMKVTATPGQDEDAGSLKIKVEAVSSNDEQGYEKVSYPLEQVEPLMAAMRIVDANGKVFRSSGYDAGGGQTMKISTKFVAEGSEFIEEEEGVETAKPQLNGPFRLIMNAPIEVVQTEVPFSFENVPLP